MNCINKITITIGVMLLAFTLTWYLSDKAHNCECSDTDVVALSGDTYWEIASTHCTGHTGHAVYEMVNLNGSPLSIGQKVQLP